MAMILTSGCALRSVMINSTRKHEVNQLRVVSAKRLPAVAGADDGVAEAGEGFLDHLGEGVVILHEQYVD
jgi:hypothetical protein